MIKGDVNVVYQVFTQLKRPLSFCFRATWFTLSVRAPPWEHQASSSGDHLSTPDHRYKYNQKILFKLLTVNDSVFFLNLPPPPEELSDSEEVH